MYEHYKPAQQIFVNREEYLSSEAIRIRDVYSEAGLPLPSHSKDEILDNEIWSEELEPIYLIF